MSDRLWMVTRNGVHSCHVVGLFASPEDAVRAAIRGMESESDGYHDFDVIAIDIGTTREHSGVGVELELTRADRNGRKRKENPIVAKFYRPPAESPVSPHLPTGIHIEELNDEEHPAW